MSGCPVRGAERGRRELVEEVFTSATAACWFGAASARGFKALLAAFPLDGIDLVRARDACGNVEQ